MKNRAYSTLDIKSVDDASGEVTLTGIASTPTPDRVDDVVIPTGAVFKLPIPLLWQHNSGKPIGKVTQARVTKSGIEIVAVLIKGLTDDIDEAITLIKSGLVRGLSIGFRGLETEQIPNSGGVIFNKWEWLELSAVTIPANAEATITSVKKFDAEALAASGRKASATHPPGGTGRNGVRVTLSSNTKAIRKGGLFDSGPKEASTMKTVSQELADWQEQLKAKNLKIDQIRQSSTGETFDKADAEQLKDLISEAKSIKEQIDILTDIESLTSAPTAKAVGEVKTFEQASAGRSNVQVKAQPKLDPGIAFARLAKAKAVSYKMHIAPDVVAAQMYGSESDTAHILKAAVVAGANVSGNWAYDLVSAEGAAYADFAAYLRPYTILGKFGTNGIPSLRSVSFRAPLILQTGGGAGYWVGEGKPIPLSAPDFDRSTLEPLKVGTISVLTMESVRDSSPASDAIVRDTLRDALSARLDTDFIDPTKTAVSGVSPASITNGVTAPNASGTDADAVRADLKTLVKAFIDGDNPPSTGVIVMKTTLALTLSLMRNSLGGREFPDITMSGGFLEGFPVITSEYVPAVTAGTYMYLINAQDIFIGDDGGFTVDVSTEASLEMKDGSLTQNSLDGTGVAMVSMYQSDLVAIRAQRTINWKKRRSTAVAAIDTIAYVI